MERVDPAHRRLVAVEGASDRIAVHTLARRLGRDLAAEGVEVVELGGAATIGRFLRAALAGRRGLGVCGLYDEAEEHFFARAIEQAGLGAVHDRGRLEQLGFFACEPDLEAELIAAVGERGVLEVLEEQRASASFRRLQAQPALSRLPQAEQMRRFIAGRSGHKARYAALLSEAVPLDRLPRPLELLLQRM